jgi:hypothetical protein
VVDGRHLVVRARVSVLDDLPPHRAHLLAPPFAGL